MFEGRAERLLERAQPLLVVAPSRLIGRLYQVSSAAGTRRFIYDGLSGISEVDGAGAIKAHYAFGEGSDEPLAWWDYVGSSVNHYLQADERGSIVAVSDSAGNATAINTYDEYGKPGAGNVGRFQYTGQMWLPEIGLYSYKARMYSAHGGRFVQPDPIGYADSPNLYNYVLGDPVNYVDPLGLSGCDATDPTADCSDIPVTGTRLGGIAFAPALSAGNADRGPNCGGDCRPIVITGGNFRPLNQAEIHFYSNFYDPDLLRQIIILNGLPPWMSEAEFNGFTVSRKFIYISSRLYRKNMLSNRISAAVLGHELYHALAQYANGLTIWDFMAASAQCRCTGSGSALEGPAYIMESTIQQMYQNGVR